MAYKLQISANMLSWPRLCACCGADSDTELRAAASRTTGVRVKHTTTSGWDVPYCSHCIKHTTAHAGASAWLYLGPIVALGLWWLFGQGYNDSRTGVIAACCSMLLSICVFCVVRVRAAGLMFETCGSVTPAVRYLAWHGTFQTFVFSSKSYLDRFLAANSRKHRSDVREVRIGGSESGGALFWCLVAGVLVWWWVSHQGDHQAISTGSAMRTERAPTSTLPTSEQLSKKARPATKHNSSVRDQKAAGSKINGAAEVQKGAPQAPEDASANGPVQDILSPVRVRDPQAAAHIASYCAAATTASTVRASAEAACRRDEIGAWQRLVEGNEFPALDESTRQKCREPPFPDSFVAKEACAKYELHVN